MIGENEELEKQRQLEIQLQRMHEHEKEMRRMQQGLRAPEHCPASPGYSDCVEPALQNCGQTQTVASTYRRPSLREEAEKNFHSHSELASKAGHAAKFLASHPEFDEFISLIREGAISI